MANEHGPGLPPHPGAPQPRPGASSSPPLPKTSGMAITALVLSLLFFIPLVPLVGAILGIVATVRISHRRNELGGFGLAVAAIPTGFVVFLFTLGIYAAIAVPAFVKYARKSKAIEATEGLDKLRFGARSYFHTDRYDESGNLLPARFPQGDTAWVPEQPCCQSSEGRCSPQESAWQVEPWRSLRFGFSEPHYYQWRYRGAGQGSQAQFIAEARGDLDCDGKYSSYKLLGKIDEENAVIVSGPMITDELE